jgi:hypothetical protein
LIRDVARFAGKRVRVTVLPDRPSSDAALNLSVRQWLAPHFFDYSDAQRLNWMIERAYELGQAKVRQTSNSSPGHACHRLARRRKVSGAEGKTHL